MEVAFDLEKYIQRIRFRLKLRQMAKHIDDEPKIAEGEPYTPETIHKIEANTSGPTNFHIPQSKERETN